MQPFQLSKTRLTRSGKVYGALPIACPPEFELSPLLRQALAFDCNDYCEDSPKHVKRNISEAFGMPEAEGLPAQGPNVKNSEPPSELPTTLETQPSGGKKQKRSHAFRRLKRNAGVMSEGHRQRPEVIHKHIKSGSETATDIELKKLPASASGYEALSSNAGHQATLSLEDLLSEGYLVVQWDGITNKPFVDHKTGKVFMVLVGQPDDEGYRKACREAFNAIETAGKGEQFTDDEVHHRRGPFPALNVGVSYGNGPKVPHNLRNDNHSAVLQNLCQNAFIKRLAIFASASFAMWAPRTFAYYKERLDKLFARLPHLQKNFDKSIFPCAAFNFGPQVCCYPHRDCMNCPFGWCAIQALGEFDSTQGGHLVLPDLKLIVEFPSGSLILIPSATLTHANTPVQPGESRISFTQFCAGALFRYVDNGFRTQAQFKKQDKVGYKKAMDEKAARWAMGLDLLSTLGDLLKSEDDAGKK